MNFALCLCHLFTNSLILLSGSPFPPIKTRETDEKEALLDLSYFLAILVKSRMQELGEWMHDFLQILKTKEKKGLLCLANRLKTKEECEMVWLSACLN